MATRSTLLTRLESELKDLDGRIENARDKHQRLESEKKALMAVISDLRKSIKKSSHSIAEMPGRVHPATA